VKRLAGPLLAAAAVLAGCGLGPGSGTSNVKLTVTRNFGDASVGSVTKSKVPGSETVMRMLERFFNVATRYGGGFVESIDHLSGTSDRRDWFYYVNGIEAAKGAAVTTVHKGDRIWWDLHDWSATNDVPAVVGSFPEPFLHGIGGRRLPTTVQCTSGVSAACKRVSKALSAAGVPFASSGLGGGTGQDSLAVVVGTWGQLKGLIAATLIDQGPGSSGVYARFTGPGGTSLQILDPQGHVARTLGSDTGLIAATADNSSEPTWLVTGTDVQGVSAAAAALTPSRLRDHFALVVHDGSDLPVPLDGGT
jgi:Domain of unknown function (DUF4430)